MPRLLRKAAQLQAAGVVLFVISLFCETAIPYLLTLGLGTLFLLLGVLAGLVDLVKHWRIENDSAGREASGES